MWFPCRKTKLEMGVQCWMLLFFRRGCSHRALLPRNVRSPYSNDELELTNILAKHVRSRYQTYTRSTDNGPSSQNRDTGWHNRLQDGKISVIMEGSYLVTV